MKQFIRRILIAFFVVKILTVSVFLVGATNNEYVSSGSFWNWIADHGKFVQSVTGYFPGSGSCPSSEDTYHHASSYQKEGNVDGDIRYRCVCDYCHQSFTAYASDFQQSYEAQVEEMPATGYSADGKLLIPYTIEAHYIGWYRGSGVPGHLSNCNSHSLLSFDGGYRGYIASYSCSSNSVSFHVKSGYSSFDNACCSYKAVLDCPYDGFYSVCTPRYEYSGFLADGTCVDGVGKVGSDGYVFGPGLGVYYSAGTINTIDENIYLILYDTSYISVTMNFLPPLAKFTPAPSVDINFDTTYNINSRPTSITGDYGIIGDNGQIIKVEGDKIVNETNNNYYNPATGETTTITDWFYNYEDRSYTVTTESGDTVTITYGDENVTIKEGDTIYNVYYLVDGSGSENPDPGPGPELCDHAWTETSRTDPTCTTAGKVTSTCSKCNQTKTETIPATGHTWVVDRTVQTTYDEEGNLLQQGYTIYSCSVCGEQYKDMEGTGPPGLEEEKSIWEKIGDFFGTIGGGFIDIINAVFGKLLDALIASAEMLIDKLKAVVEAVLSIFEEVPAMFGGFLAFLTAMFPFLPPEIMTLLTFGIAAVVFIGIIKAIRR